jgi:hypothetical protein
MLPQRKAPPDEAAPVQIAVRNGDQPDWVLAVRTVGGGAELMHDFKARARLADAEQHSAVVAPTVKLSAIQISVGTFRQKAGRVAAGIVVVRAGRKSVQQSELPAGRDFEDRPPLRIRLSFLGHFAYAVKVAVRRPDDVVGAAAAWTILELRDAKARQSNQLRRLRACRECTGYQQ